MAADVVGHSVAHCLSIATPRTIVGCQQSDPSSSSRCGHIGSYACVWELLAKTTTSLYYQPVYIYTVRRPLLPGQENGGKTLRFPTQRSSARLPSGPPLPAASRLLAGAHHLQDGADTDGRGTPLRVHV